MMIFVFTTRNDDGFSAKFFIFIAAHTVAYYFLSRPLSVRVWEQIDDSVNLKHYNSYVSFG